MKLSSLHEGRLPTPTKREMLDVQTKLIDDDEMPNDFDVELKAESSPPVPVIYVNDSAGKPVVKIMPMRNGRYRVLDFDSNEDYYFDHDFKETHMPSGLPLHDRVMNSVRLRK